MACTTVVGGREQYGLSFYVELPLMHMTLELFLKAHAAIVDTKFNPKNYGHKTMKIINDYADRLKFFEILKNDPAKMQLIEGLEHSWEAVRYAEVYVQYDGNDWRLFKELVVELADDYHKVTGVQLLGHHSPSR